MDSVRVAPAAPPTPPTPPRPKLPPTLIVLPSERPAPTKPTVH